MNGNLGRLLVGIALALTALLISAPAALAMPGDGGGGGDKTISDLKKEGYTCGEAGVGAVFCKKKGSPD